MFLGKIERETLVLRGKKDNIIPNLLDYSGRDADVEFIYHRGGERQASRASVGSFLQDINLKYNNHL